jgi:galactokinase
VRSVAPGRVNLIGDHTDYSFGLAMPMALEQTTTVTGRRGGDRVRLRSEGYEGVVDLPLRVDDPAAVTPAWGRYVAGVVAELEPTVGFEGEITTAVPVGMGLSSSAALEVAVALALGALDALPAATAEDVVALALRCQRAEHRATGVPCGLMDQLVALAGVAGHALLIDFRSLVITPIAVPEGLEIVVVDSGQRRDLADSDFGRRHEEVQAAERLVGPLRDATLADLRAIADPTIRVRARHVVTENDRVLAFADALRAEDLAAAGAVVREAHISNRDDFASTTPVIDALVDRLTATPGVHGARLTGGGFGGCVVALTEAGALDEGWVARPSPGARVDAG